MLGLINVIECFEERNIIFVYKSFEHDGKFKADPTAPLSIVAFLASVFFFSEGIFWKGANSTTA
jgi:hypothetical protein